MTINWVQVCSTEDLIENSGVAALCGDHQVAIFYVPSSEKKVFAVDNHDPFSGSNVLSRGLVADLDGKLVVASPIYKQHFDIDTGSSTEDENVSVVVWPAKMVDGQVLIGLA